MVGSRVLRVMVALPALWTAFGLERGHAGAEEAYRGMAVSVAKAETKCFKDQIRASGFLGPKSEIKVWGERNGLQIGQVFVEPGDSVGTGQVLARLVAPSGAPPQTVAVRAPASGVVVGVTAVVGSNVSTSAADPLFRIVVDGELEMRGDVVATALPKLQLGQVVVLDVIGIGPFDGHVAAVETSVDPLTQLGAVHVAFAPDPRLRPGVFARATIDAGQTCAVAVPLSAVLYGGEGDVVEVVRGDHVETRRVEIGPSQGGFVQIQDGIDPGDVVVERAGAFLREGDPVRPVASPAKP